MGLAIRSFLHISVLLAFTPPVFCQSPIQGIRAEDVINRMYARDVQREARSGDLYLVLPSAAISSAASLLLHLQTIQHSPVCGPQLGKVFVGRDEYQIK